MRSFTAPLLALLLAPSLVSASDVVRHKLPGGSTFPILAAVEVPAGKTTVYLSGMVPKPTNADAGKDVPAVYGDTKTQTISVMNVIKAQLESIGLTMKDVVKMQVFLVGDPAKEGKLDFGGFMQGYSEFFGTAEQPNLPTRSTMQVAALVNPAFLVEIEVTAVRP